MEQEMSLGAVERGCGKRKKGGIYFEVRLGPGGRPLEDFLIDPPLKLTPDAVTALGIRPIGVSTLVREGVTHVVDWVGAEYYPNLADFLEEVRHFGLSRRVAANFPFASLSRSSRLYIVHSRGWLNNADRYLRRLAKDAAPESPYTWAAVRPCPKRRPDHNDLANPTMCAQLWWQDVEGGEFVKVLDRLALGRRIVRRSMPAFNYFAVAPPEGVQPDHCLAMVASFPIPRIAVVNDPDDPDEVERRLGKARESGIPTEVEEE